MNNYEGLFIIRPDIEGQELTQLYQKIQDSVKKYNGEIEKAEEPGKKLLSYKLGKYKDGTYYILTMKLDPASLSSLTADLKLNENILRTIFTRL